METILNSLVFWYWSLNFLMAFMVLKMLTDTLFISFLLCPFSLVFTAHWMQEKYDIRNVQFVRAIFWMVFQGHRRHLHVFFRSKSTILGRWPLVGFLEWVIFFIEASIKIKYHDKLFKNFEELQRLCVKFFWRS